MQGSSLNRNGVRFYEYCCRILLLGNAFLKNLCQDYIVAPFHIMEGGVESAFCVITTMLNRVCFWETVTEKSNAKDINLKTVSYFVEIIITILAFSKTAES